MVKGLFDKRGPELQIMVTGSARLDYYRWGGDSLQIILEGDLDLETREGIRICSASRFLKGLA